MIKDSSETSRFPNFFIFLDILRRARVRRFCRMREQAPRAFGAAPQRWASCCRLCRTCNKPPAPRFATALPPGVGLLVAGLAERGNKPPAPSALPPKTGGDMARVLASRFAWGALMKLIADLASALAQNTHVQQATCLAPRFGGQREARGACHTLCKTFTMSKTPTAHPTPSLPPSRTRSVRHRGAADERE